MWIVSLLVPVTAIVQVGGGILQGAQDFDYQVRRKGGSDRGKVQREECVSCPYIYIISLRGGHPSRSPSTHVLP